LTENYSINVPKYYGQPERVVRVWTLHKGRKEAHCEIWTHPIGAELRVEAGGEFVRSEAIRDKLALVDRSVEWERQFTGKGWTR
jgi:hypothetical protein